MGSFTQWAIGLAVGLFLWLAGIHLSRREARIKDVVSRYVVIAERMPEREQINASLRMLLDAGALTLRNNSELCEARRRIDKLGFGDPGGWNSLRGENLHRFFRFVRKHDLRVNDLAGSTGAIAAYKGAVKVA